MRRPQGLIGSLKMVPTGVGDGDRHGHGPRCMDSQEPRFGLCPIKVVPNQV